MGFPGGLEALDGRWVVALLEKLHARVEMGHGRFEEQVLGPHVAVLDGLERVPGKSVWIPSPVAGSMARAALASSMAGVHCMSRA